MWTFFWNQILCPLIMNGDVFWIQVSQRRNSTACHPSIIIIIRCYNNRNGHWKISLSFCASFYFVVWIIPSFVFWAVIFVFHSVWWQLPLFECDKFGDTAPLTVYYLICTVTNYVKVDHHCLIRGNFCSCKKKSLKKIVQDSNSWRLRYRCSALTTWANKPTARSSGKRAAPVSQRSRVWILYRPEFFSGFLFTTATISVMIYFHIILHPAVHIYV